ncbi:MAG: precorrin-6y C5 15-methyltransferase subunit CbiE/precorrin-6Y C5 15-methyltransferase subunit CbiT [Rhodospirillaceae bacterium]|nr:MAG: precorrin-6y C5 15-methyltransferase subunit CbiE/precorrin-6Y C5 15-methyltransferase subunit CbiT [Rhodospirillaceae bacterium]
MTVPWLAVVGVGEDGEAGLSPAARTLIGAARVVLGGKRLLERVAALVPTTADCVSWAGVEAAFEALEAHRGQQVVVLASGDPMFYGLGATLTRRFAAAEMIVVPQASAFSLAAARLGWPLQEVETLSVHGRALETLAFHFAPGVRLLVLSENGETPGRVAALLTAHGFGPSPMTVLEHMGGAAERQVTVRADQWPGGTRTADLNTLAIACRADEGRQGWGRTPGLPDEAYLHDGQLTKREIRAVTLAALAPRPGEMLWDIGAGAGSIAIEWLRTHPATLAVAVEQDTARLATIAANAVRLGVPRLQGVLGCAPFCLAGLSAPTAVFVGGGVSASGLLETCWAALPIGGRMVVNAVTIEAEARLLAWQGTHGGTLTRLSVARLRPMGRLRGWKPLAPVTQYQAMKTISAE